MVIDIFSVFTPIHNSLITIKKVTNQISTGVSPKNIKPFDANLAPTMTNSANGRLSLKLNNSVLVQKRLLYYILALF